MSYFNADQEAYMRYLDSLPPEQKCYCGWYLFGKCPNPESNCPKNKTCADKLRESRPLRRQRAPKYNERGRREG